VKEVLELSGAKVQQMVKVQVGKFLLRLGNETSLIYYKDCLYLYHLLTRYSKGIEHHKMLWNMKKSCMSHIVCFFHFKTWICQNSL